MKLLFSPHIRVVQALPIRQCAVALMSTLPHFLDRTSVMSVAQSAGARSKHRLISAREIVRAEPGTTTSNDAWVELVAAFRAGAVQVDLTDLTASDVVYIPEAFAHGVCPDRFPARLTALLYERYVAVHGDPQRGVTFTSSDRSNPHPNDVCHCVLEHAQNWALPGAFAQWITRSPGLVSAVAVARLNFGRHVG